LHAYETDNEISLQHENDKDIESNFSTINELSDIGIFNSYNERGLDYFFEEKYSHALEDFNKVLERGLTHSDLDDVLLGSALWGRTLCHAYLGLENATIEDIQLLRDFFIETRQCISNRTEVKCANPNENISKNSCEERVVGTANAMRILAVAIKKSELGFLVNQFIDELEKVGIRCCRDGSFWTSCVTPLLEKLEKWKAFGIPSDPYWD
jgi:hypothetical protein